MDTNERIHKMNELQKAQLAVEQANQAVLEASETIQKLVAENAALKAAFNPVEIPGDAVDAFGDTAEFDWDSNESGSWTWVENDTDVIRAVLDAMPKPETPATDAFTAELRAQGVDEFANDFQGNAHFSRVAEFARTFAANLRAGRKG
jgi:hypothetical protein